MISPLSKTLVNFVILSVFIITSFLTTPVTVSSPRDHNFNNLVAQELISDYDFYNQSLTAKSIENFLLNQPSTLKNKQSAMGGVSVPIYQAIVDASISNKSTINSKILICLLEIKYYLLSSPSPSEYALTHPLGLNNIDGFHPQLIYIANAMEEAYINYSVPSSRIVSLADNTNISLESSPNAGTFAIQSALAIMSQNEEDFYHLLTKKNNSFIATYNRYFSSKDGVAQRSQIMSTATPFLYRP